MDIDATRVDDVFAFVMSEKDEPQARGHGLGDFLHAHAYTHRLGRFGGLGGVKRPAPATLSQEIFDICIKLLTLDRRRVFKRAFGKRHLRASSCFRRECYRTLSHRRLTELRSR